MGRTGRRKWKERKKKREWKDKRKARWEWWDQERWKPSKRERQARIDDPSDTWLPSAIFAQLMPILDSWAHVMRRRHQIALAAPRDSISFHSPEQENQVMMNCIQSDQSRASINVSFRKRG
jgi:hypothetical protein